MSVEEHFAMNMKRRREDLGISQSDMGRQMKERGFAFHQQTVQRIETGERPVRLAEASAIAEVLDVPLNVLMSAPRRAAVDHWGRAAHVAYVQIESAVAAYNDARFQLAGSLDHLETAECTVGVLGFGESWVPQSALDVVASIPLRVLDKEIDRNDLAAENVEVGGPWLRLFFETEHEVAGQIDAEVVAARVEERIRRNAERPDGVPYVDLTSFPRDDHGER